MISFMVVFSYRSSSGQINVDIGSGSSTTVGGSATSPITQAYTGLRYQVIYTKAEIEAAGGVAGTISQFGWRVSSNATGLTNYTISLGHTSNTTLSSIVTTGLTQVYTTATFAPVNSGSGNYHMLTLSTPFDWNGTDNLIVNVCYTRSTTSTSGGQVYSYSGTNGAARYISGSTPCSLTGTGFSNFSTKPQIRMVLTEAPPTGNVDIGSGSSSTAGGSATSPITQGYTGLRYQVIYTKAEIEAAGGAAGAISQFGWRVASNATGLTNYTISFGHTTLSTLSSTVTTGLTQVYTTTTYAPVNSGSGNYHMLTLSTPFNWNGTDNLIINVCYTRSTTSTSGGQVYSYAGLNAASRYVSNATPCTATTVSNSNFSTKPQIRMVMPIVESSCEAPSDLSIGTVTTSSAQFSWANGAPTIGYTYTVTTSATAPVSGTNATGSSITISSGLSEGTGYYFWIRNRCTASSNSDWVSIPFATACTAPTLTTTPGSRCGTGSVALGASPSAGTVYWWDAASDGNLLGTGTTFNTPSISATTTYYASTGQLLAGNLIKTLGAGANTSTIASQSPFHGSTYQGESTNYLIRASELIEAGIGAGYITSLGLDVVAAGGALNTFNIRMANTSEADLSSAYADASTYYYGNNINGVTYSPTVGINTFNLSGSGFLWDGTSNISIIIYWQNSSSPGASSVKYDAVSFTATRYQTLLSSSWSSQFSVNSRPKFILNGKGLCMSARQAVDATVDTGSYTYYRDLDEDGFGDATNSTTVCSATPPVGYVTNNTDCNDALITYLDNDGDGYGADVVVSCGVSNNSDCNDNNNAVHPGTTEICGDGIDNNCNGVAEETCPTPSNDNPAYNNPVLNSTSYVYPNCAQIMGTTAGSSASANTGLPDVWYQFTAISNGVSIRVSSNQMNSAIYLYSSSDLQNPLKIENSVSNTGTEILNFGALTPGASYRIAVTAIGGVTGSFNICIQNLRYPICGSGGTYTLCSAFIATNNGASSITYNFTNGASTTSVNSTTIITLNNPSLQLSHGNTYSVGLTANYTLQNGIGTPELIQVSNPSACSVTIGAHPLVEVKSNMRCSNGAILYRSSYLQAAAENGGNVCGVTGYRVEFTKVLDCAGNPTPDIEPYVFSKIISSTSPFISLSYAFNQIPIANNPSIGYWSVRWKPLFGSTEGVYGSARVIGVNGTAPAAMGVQSLSDNIVSNDIVDDLTFGLYPNPNNGELVNLNLTGSSDDIVFVRIIDGTGRVIYSNRYAVEGSLNTVVNFSNPLAAGFYLVELTTANEVITQRMMVAK